MEGVRKEVVTSGTDRAQARPDRKEEWHTRAMGRCKRGWRERLESKAGDAACRVSGVRPRSRECCGQSLF